MPAPIVAEVARIGSVADPVLRNLLITQAYHDLSLAVARRIGKSANWCTFATWASRQAGDTIRGDDLRRATERVLGAPGVVDTVERVVSIAARGVGLDGAALRRGILQNLDIAVALQRAASAVADGNRKVFVEIGHEFARWLTECVGDGAADGSASATFCASLRDGEPPHGQRLLREAFAAYSQAEFAREDEAREAWILLANLLVGQHEQTRLQPEIRAALDSALDAPATKARLLALLLPSGWLRMRATLSRMLARPMPLDEALDELIGAVQREVRRAVTDLLMTLRLPGGVVVHLGDDVRPSGAPPVRSSGNQQLIALLDRVDPCAGEARGSGATDWADLAQRMHFISELFRAHQRRAAMLDAPFTAAQVDDIAGGRVPIGGL